MSANLTRCDLPSWILASAEFNARPQPIAIQGVLDRNRWLFARLDEIPGQPERALTFHEYMSVKFYLHQWEDEANPSARRALKNSYVRFLRGWGADSNSLEGAVLKGWVESRLGITPTFHKVPLGAVDTDDYSPYAFDRMRGHARTNDIDGQLDLLYTYTQYELGRSLPGQQHLTLYRGTYDAAAHPKLVSFGPRNYVVRLNNLVSFTADRERAWEFGTTVWEAAVPICKVFFYGDLFPESILRGETEYLVIGGEYQVREVLG